MTTDRKLFEQRQADHRAVREDEQVDPGHAVHPQAKKHWRVTIYLQACKPVQARLYRDDFEDLVAGRWTVRQVGGSAYVTVLIPRNTCRDAADVPGWICRALRVAMPHISERMVTVSEE